MFKKNLFLYTYEIILIIVWILFALIINPIGNFPLNDDWAYGKTVETLLKEGIYRPENWPAMTLIAQIYWGYLISLIFGFSFTILRFFTIILGIIGILFLYRILKKIALNNNVAFIGALIMVINPLYLSLSYTFMTDVPFAAIFIIATYFFFEALKKQNNLFLILASFFSLIAIFIRQLGLLLPLSFAITYIISHKLSKRSVIKVIIPFIISVLILQIFSYWLKNTGRMPENYEKVGGLINVIKEQFNRHIFNDFVFRIGISFRFCAIFLLPLMIFIAPKVFSKLICAKKYLSFWISGILTVIYFFVNFSRFFISNILYNIGIGPKLLKDTYILHNNNSPYIDKFFIYVISVIGILLLFILLVLLVYSFIELVQKIKKREFDFKVKILIFSFLTLIFYSYFLFISVSYFDRYFIISLILILFILIASYGDTITYKGNVKRISAFVTFFIIACFSIIGTHDYLSWNRARWKAINYLLEEKKISPHQIDGGFEFNGYYKTGPRRPENSKISWWFVDKDDYIISFGKIEGYSSIKSYSFPYLLIGTNNKIEILKRDSTSIQQIN